MRVPTVWRGKPGQQVTGRPGARLLASGEVRRLSASFDEVRSELENIYHELDLVQSKLGGVSLEEQYGRPLHDDPTAYLGSDYWLG